MKPYLVKFRSQRHQFRLTELEALADLAGTRFEYDPSQARAVSNWRSNEEQTPFIMVKYPSDDIVQKIAERSVTAQGFYQVLAEGETVAQVKEILDKETSILSPFLASKASFKISVDVYGAKFSQEEQVKIIESLNLPLWDHCSVDLKTPTHHFVLFIDTRRESAAQGHQKEDAMEENGKEEEKEEEGEQEKEGETHVKAQGKKSRKMLRAERRRKWKDEMKEQERTKQEQTIKEGGKAGTEEGGQMETQAESEETERAQERTSEELPVVSHVLSDGVNSPRKRKSVDSVEEEPEAKEGRPEKAAMRTSIHNVKKEKKVKKKEKRERQKERAIQMGQQGVAVVKSQKVWFTVTIAEGVQGVVSKYDLKKRAYIGTTSMDSELSLLVANQAHAKPASLVYDPFVGTGSLLIAAAHFGAYTMGGDIDPTTFRGTEADKSVLANYKQYGLLGQFVDLVVCDGAHTCWREEPFLDAIIADPPYGVREGARKVGKKRKTILRERKLGAEEVKERRSKAERHVTQCIPYPVDAVLFDLLLFSAKRLRMGGRLVYWLPTSDQYKESDLPLHPCLRIVANSEQPLCGRMRRRLITMVKTTAYNPAIHDNLPPEAYGQLNASHAFIADYIMRKEDLPTSVRKAVERDAQVQL